MIARIQRIDEQPSIAVYIGADVVKSVILPDQDWIEFNPEVTSDGILLRIGGTQ